jgi:hypothetical protein
MTMADGGILPEIQGGTVSPDLESALATVQGSLASGRKQFGLPAQLMGGNQPSSADMSPKPSGAEESQTQDSGSPNEPYTPGYGNDAEAGQQNTAQQPPAGQGLKRGGKVKSFDDGGNMDDPSSMQLAAPSFDSGGMIPGAANPDEGLLQASAAQREAVEKAQLAAKEGQGSHPVYPGYDAGGAIPDGGNMDDPQSQGMPPQPQDNMPAPQQGQTQPANDPQQALQMYAMGAGAVPPQMAQALEQKVDPTGSMDPSQRKLLAVASAPDPKTQFGMMQHYRQRFNALNSFARAAGTGTQARPADIAASTQAATRAFHNVPNGHSISFSPAGPNHVAVTIAQYAGGKDGAGKKGKGYAAGGPVPDDLTAQDAIPDASETGPQDTSGVMPDTSAAAAALVSGAQDAQDVEANSDETMTQPVSGADAQAGMQAAEGAIPSGNPVLGAARAAGKVYRSATEGGEKIKQSVMSVPQYLSTLKNSLYDAFMDTPPDSALADAANKSWANSLNAPGMENGNTLDQGQGLTSQPPTSGMTIGAPPGHNPITNATSPVKAGAPSPSTPSTPAQLPPGMTDVGGGISLMQPTPQGVQGMRTMLAADNNGQGARPAQATIPGFDPRIMAQANAMYPPGSQAWKDFATRAQTGLVTAGNERSMQQLKNQGMKDLWGGREAAINSRADARNATSLQNGTARNATSIQRAQIIAGQRAIASGNNNVSGVMKAIINAVPGTTPKDAFTQAQTLLSQRGSPVQDDTDGQSPAAAATQAPAQQPITGPIAVNPQTGQRMTVRNGQWVPLP